MGVYRIVRRNLQGTGEVTHKADRTWVDNRSRDKYGILSGHCSEMAKRVVSVLGKKVIGIPSGAVGIHI